MTYEQLANEYNAAVKAARQQKLKVIVLMALLSLPSFFLVPATTLYLKTWQIDQFWICTLFSLLCASLTALTISAVLELKFLYEQRHETYRAFAPAAYARLTAEKKNQRAEPARPPFM